MAETAVHLVDHVFPPLPVRQWVLAVPKRLRYFLLRDVNGRCTSYSVEKLGFQLADGRLWEL